MDGRPPAAYIASKTGDNSAREASAKCLMTRSGWLGGTRSSRSTNANIVACGSRRPRMHTTSLEDGSTISVPPTQPEEPNPTGVGVFPQPADMEGIVKGWCGGAGRGRGQDVATMITLIFAGQQSWCRMTVSRHRSCPHTRHVGRNHITG